MADRKQRITVETVHKDRGLSRGLDDISNKSKSAFGGKGGMASMAGKARLALLALPAAAVGAGFAIGRMALNIAAQNDQLAKMSDRIGASTEALSQYKFVAERSGVSFNTLTMGWQRMTRRVAEAAVGMGEARSALKELNLDATTLSQLAPEDQFERIAEEISKVGSQSDKVRLAMKLFDSEGVALVQTMKNGVEGLRELRTEADRFGLTVSTEAAAQAAEFQDSLTNLKAASDGLAQSLGQSLIPKLTAVLKTITKINEDPIAWSFFFRHGIQGRPLGNVVGNLGAAGTPPPEKPMERAWDPTAPFGGGFDFSKGRPTGDLPTEHLLGITDRGTMSSTRTSRSAIERGVPGLGVLTGGPSMVQAGEISGQSFTAGFGRAVKTAGQTARITGDGGGIMNALAFGGSTNTEDVIRRLSDTTGDQAAAQTMQSWRTRTAKQAQEDVIIPWGDVANSAGEAFVDTMETSMTVGLANFILTGDLEQSAKTFGATLVAGMVVHASGQLAEGLVGGIGDLFDDPKARELLAKSGRRMGGLLSDASEEVLGRMEVPKAFTDMFGPEGSVGGEVAAGLGRSVQGALLGAGIGTLIGDEINAASGAIGGAIGNAFAGPVGGIVGSIVGAVAGTHPSVERFISQVFGVTDKQTRLNVRDLGTDIQAFGGLQGFFKRIGGFAGIRGERAQAIGSREGGSALKRLIRLQFGATSEQAEAVLDVLIAGGAAGAHGNVFVGPEENFIPSRDEILTVLRNIGLDEGSLGRIIFSSGMDAGNPNSEAETALPTDFELNPLLVDRGIDTPPPPEDPTEPPPASKTVVVSRGTVSIGSARTALRDGRRAFDDYLKRQNVGVHSPVYNNLLNMLTTTNPGIEQTARDWLVNSSGYDIQAATGFVGRVNRPTHILAGEAGPENVAIMPAAGGDGFLGGAASAGRTELHYTATINVLDASGVDQAAARLGETLRQQLLALSERGLPVVHSKGVVTPPSV